MLLSRIPSPALTLLLLAASLLPDRAASDPVEPVPSGYRILFAGDTSYGENYSVYAGRLTVVGIHGYDYSFAKLDPLLVSASLVIANLETPVTDMKESPLVGKSYLEYR